MKLCHVVPSLQEKHGGPSKSVRSLCGALARAGHDVELLTTAPDASPGGEVSVVGNLCVRTFRRDFPRRVCVSTGLAAALRGSRPEVVHHHSLWLRTLHYSRREADRRGVPLVVSPRGMMSRWAWRHHRWRKRLSQILVHPGALAHAAGWHATSQEEETEVHALGFTQPVCVSPNGVEAPTEAESSAAAAYWRAACPEVNGRRTALFYGRFHQKKRVIELIDAWLENAPPDWLLLLVGLPEQYTPAMLERYAQKLSASGRIRAFSGAGRPPPYAVASLFLLPSHSENFGLTIAEAMAHQMPVIVTDATPWSAVNTAQRGWCVPWADYPRAIRAATAATEADLRDRGARSGAWVVREYSWDVAARRLLDFYRTLLASHR